MLRLDVTSGLACAVVAIIVAAAIAAPILTIHAPLDQDLLAINRPPSGEHALGTDGLGRDVYARLLNGARTTLLVGVLGTGLAFTLGAGLGLMCLVLGRVSERLFYAAIDLVRALPETLMGVLLIVALGSGTMPVIVALGLAFTPMVALVARAAYQREMARDYVRAARSFGGGRLHLMRHHILPNLAGLLITQAGIILPRSIVTESVLSFLGLGSSPDEPTWGRMIADASRFIEQAPHAILAPISALVLLTIALSLLGDRLRRLIDPGRSHLLSAGTAPATTRCEGVVP